MADGGDPNNNDKDVDKLRTDCEQLQRAADRYKQDRMHMKHQLQLKEWVDVHSIDPRIGKSCSTSSAN